MSPILSAYSPSAESVEAIGFEDPACVRRVVDCSVSVAINVTEIALVNCNASLARLNDDVFRTRVDALSIRECRVSTQGGPN